VSFSKMNCRYFRQSCTSDNDR